MPSPVPLLRIRGDGDVNRRGRFVLYWMTAFRRTRWNFALQQAVHWAIELRKPLIVLEALRVGYSWASDRMHQFVIQGMADNARALEDAPAYYYPYLEPVPGAGKGLLAALAREACVVVGDEYPCFFLPRMQAAARRQIPVRYETVDSNGLLPLRAADRAFARAFDFRRHLQRTLPPLLAELPAENPLDQAGLPAPDELPPEVARRWPAADPIAAAADVEFLAALDVDHAVRPSPIRGGPAAGEAALADFVAERLPRYGEDRNHPDDDASSGLSPYLHFGHVSAHQVVAEVLASADWKPGNLTGVVDGSRGWWGAPPSVEAFLDELVTWRELGFNFCSQRDDFDQYDSLPDWARQTLAEHEGDAREPYYSPEQFETAATHDELWNAAQRQLVRVGRIHNYLRMLWGKKILHWSPTPRDALATMIELNNKYALDGRDPNSYSGIFWVLGRYDRAWGPERPIFGKIRYMTSDSTRKKLRVDKYLDRFSASVQGQLF